MTTETRDDELRRGLADDEPAALATLWERMGDDIYAVAVSVLRSRHDAEDVTQEVFIKIVRCRESVARASNPRAYMLRMAHNEAVSVARRRGRTESWAHDDTRWLGLAAPVCGASPGAREEVERAMTALPDDQRLVVALRAFRGMKLREISACAGIPLNTAASRLRYGLEKLRAALGSAR